jgi:hypothetical protein
MVLRTTIMIVESMVPCPILNTPEVAGHLDISVDRKEGIQWLARLMSREPVPMSICPSWFYVDRCLAMSPNLPLVAIVCRGPPVDKYTSRTAQVIEKRGLLRLGKLGYLVSVNAPYESNGREVETMFT